MKKFWSSILSQSKKQINENERLDMGTIQKKTGAVGDVDWK